MRIEDYGLIGNTLTAALVGKNGSIDWLCLPAFDGAACFAALLGDENNGCWKIAPAREGATVTRRYLGATAILETTFETETGTVTVTDFMPYPEPGAPRVDLVRVVAGVSGRVELESRLILRFDYGNMMPWVQKAEGGVTAYAGPDAVHFHSDAGMKGEDFKTISRFTVSAGETRQFCLTGFPSHREIPERLDAQAALAATKDWWATWLSQAKGFDRWNEAVQRSLITLKAMTFSPTGAIVAAPTMGLPEGMGGERNWDYRYCWIRDSTLSLYAFLISGFSEEAKSWRRWLLRAAAGEPSKLQIMYGLRGERRLTEFVVPWLKGYEDSRPVRVGNAAHLQLQLDVYGELMDTLHVARKFELEGVEDAWRMQKAFVKFIEEVWEEPDNGIWEVRGEPQHFTHSKIMAWVAIDRAIKGVEDFGLEGPVEHWRALRDRIHTQICERAYSPEKGCFTQAYGSQQMDAALLLMAQLGFVAPDDPRYLATVKAVEEELMEDGLVLRYRTDGTHDGLKGSEGAFLACSFWLVDAYALAGRFDDAVALFNRLLDLRNDLGLLAEEYGAKERRQLGNFPQAFSHIGLINSAHNLVSHRPPAKDRANGKAGDVAAKDVGG